MACSQTELRTSGSIDLIRPPLSGPNSLSDFRELRREGLHYVDKSLLIRDVIDDAAKVILLPRPRRFGKTLNLSMLRAYFSKDEADSWPLFAGLAIAEAGDAYRAHQGRYPTISVTFKDIKARTWQDCRAALALLIGDLFGAHSDLLEGGALRPGEREDFSAILERRADNAVLWSSLRLLSHLLHRHHGERVLILVDEYDTPIHAGYTGGYYEDVIEFFRNLLSGGLKDNTALYKGVLTGVLRVARDSLFTGLNNLDVYGLLRREYATYFGFTEAEVQALLARGDRAAELQQVQRWYNGYVFGGQVIYNPWSVLSYLKNQDPTPRPYWVDTSGNELIRELLLQQQGGTLGEAWQQLLRGESIERPIRDSVALRDLREEPGLLWSFLLFTGYLKVVALRQQERTLLGSLAIPNEEVAALYEGQFTLWLDQGLGGDEERRAFLRALLAGRADEVERYLETLLLRHASFHDTAFVPQPERFYHGLVLGLLTSLSKDYDVRSNPEAGYGRCDLLIAPRQPGRPGVVLELKVADRRRKETLAAALKDAQRQLIERDYAASLRQGGASVVHELAVAWQDKDVRVEPARRPRKGPATVKKGRRRGA
jgi:hypothetical protein